MSELFEGVEVISGYSRAQAIEEGQLVDVSEVAREAGFLWPVALTSAVWADCVEWTDEDTKRQVYQDQAGRLWDVVNMCFQVARYVQSMDTFYYVIFRVPRGGRGVKARMARLKAMIGPSDNAEPVVTIMQPQED